MFSEFSTLSIFVLDIQYPYMPPRRQCQAGKCTKDDTWIEMGSAVHLQYEKFAWAKFSFSFFQTSMLWSFYFQLGKYREKIFFQKLNYWNILASEFVSSPLRNPRGSSRWDVHPYLTKDRVHPITFFFTSLSYYFLEIISFKRWKFMLNIYQMWVPLVNEWI